jgi:hypothetical protein
LRLASSGVFSKLKKPLVEDKTNTLLIALYSVKAVYYSVLSIILLFLVSVSEIVHGDQGNSGPPRRCSRVLIGTNPFTVL